MTTSPSILHLSNERLEARSARRHYRLIRSWASRDLARQRIALSFRIRLAR